MSRPSPSHRRWDATEEDALDAGLEPTTTTACEGRRRPKGEVEGGRQEIRIIADRPTADRRLGLPSSSALRLLFLLVFYSIDLR